MSSHLSLAAGTRGAWGLGFALLLALLFSVFTLQAKEYPVEQQRIEQFFPNAEVSAAEGDYQVRTLTKGCLLYTSDAADE